jgi:CheY-like chemotaxis protein
LGFEVFRAIDGEEALRLASPIAPLESRPFDIILVDLKMPGLDGYEATRRLRRLEAACGWSPTPIIALTANAFEEKRGFPSVPGFDAFLVKPVEFGALAGTVERVCAAHTAPRRERLRAS